MLILDDALRILAQCDEKYSEQEILGTIERANVLQRQYDDMCLTAPDETPDEAFSDVEVFHFGSASRSGSCQIFTVRKWQKQISQYERAISRLQSALSGKEIEIC